MQVVGVGPEEEHRLGQLGVGPEQLVLGPRRVAPTR
jgi:hypothetical protein